MDIENNFKSSVSLSTLDFLKSNVYNITDITRKNKLTEILDKFSKETTDEVFIIQNSKNKDAKGVFLDLEFFQELLMYKEVLDQALDNAVIKEASLRKDEKATLSLTDVFEDDDIDFDQLLKEIGE
ncbi:hypothetical protein [Siminovitchia sp. 179-K 8D1 HS]|uniref:hypothetical protein n=1 Tax=Siminovitchia sp. 179-K 8D1 HS TaxID=3142385 RepID=UPI0039A35A71